MPLASLSLDLDNLWSYLKTHGDPGWETLPSYLDLVVPRVLKFLDERRQKITFFIVGLEYSIGDAEAQMFLKPRNRIVDDTESPRSPRAGDALCKSLPFLFRG